MSEELGIDYTKAKSLIDKYIKDDIVKKHVRESEVIMRELAKHLGEDEEQWGIIGLLHDIDWDITKDDVKNHCILSVEILRKEGGTDFLIESCISHGYGFEEIDVYIDKKRTTKVQWALAASETLTGLIIASALMQPDKKLASVKVKSLKKKFKNKNFARNCNRNIIRECENLDLELDEFLEIGLRALQGISDELGM